MGRTVDLLDALVKLSAARLGRFGCRVVGFDGAPPFVSLDRLRAVGFLLESLRKCHASIIFGRPKRRNPALRTNGRRLGGYWRRGRMPSMTPPDRAKAGCIFCGATNRELTKEHAWSDWLVDVFREFKASTYYRDTGSMESWVTKSFTATVRVVCEQCNNTWMSEIDNAAKPLLIPMVRPGAPLGLNSYQQRDVARWAFLRAIILQYTGNQRVVPQSHVTEFFTKRRPPMQTVIRIAAYSQPYTLTSYRAGGGGWDDYRSGEFYIITETVGTLAFHIFGHTRSDQIDINFGPLEPALMKIWPAGGLIAWPPKIGLDDQGVDALHNSFPANWTPAAQVVRDRGLTDAIRRHRRG